MRRVVESGVDEVVALGTEVKPNLLGGERSGGRSSAARIGIAPDRRSNAVAVSAKRTFRRRSAVEIRSERPARQADLDTTARARSDVIARRISTPSSRRQREDTMSCSPKEACRSRGAPRVASSLGLAFRGALVHFVVSSIVALLWLVLDLPPEALGRGPTHPGDPSIEQPLNRANRAFRPLSSSRDARRAGASILCGQRAPWSRGHGPS